jgi:hypothetical protein
LADGQQYFVAIAATNAQGGAATSNFVTFTTAFGMRAGTGASVATGAPREVGRALVVVDGVVTPNGASVSSVFCRFADSPGGVSTGSVVPASPSVIAGTAGPTTVSCSVDGLRSGTTYFYALFAESVGGTASGQLAAVTTRGEVGSAVRPPDRIRRSGDTVLLPGRTLSPWGIEVKVAVTVRVPGGGAAAVRSVRILTDAAGRVVLRTFGTPLEIRVVYTADAPLGGEGFRLISRYMT